MPWKLPLYFGISRSYALVAPTLFTKENYDGFFLEYDDDRSGDFDPLKYIPKGEGGPTVVLGLVTSKTGELEDKELIKKRIQEASQYVPLQQICLSPQCGFFFNPSWKQINGRTTVGQA